MISSFTCFLLSSDAISYYLFLEDDAVKNFIGDSYLAYTLNKPFDELFTSLSIHFKTESNSNQILFYANGKDYFIVEVSNLVSFYLLLRLFFAKF